MSVCQHIRGNIFPSVAYVLDYFFPSILGPSQHFLLLLPCRPWLHHCHLSSPDSSSFATFWRPCFWTCWLPLCSWCSWLMACLNLSFKLSDCESCHLSLEDRLEVKPRAPSTSDIKCHLMYLWKHLNTPRGSNIGCDGLSDLPSVLIMHNPILQGAPCGRAIHSWSAITVVMMNVTAALAGWSLLLYPFINTIHQM